MTLPAFLISMGAVGIGVLCFALLIGFPQLNTPFIIRRGDDNQGNSDSRRVPSRPGSGQEESLKVGSGHTKYIVRCRCREKCNNRDGLCHGVCVICRYEICQIQRNAQTTICGHTFHENCLDNWLLHGNTCPTCKSSL